MIQLDKKVLTQRSRKMYHISDDIRTQKSAAKIVSGLITCAKNKPLAAITVSTLLREAKVSRSTFYRLFDNVIDVLEYECDRISTQILEKKGNPNSFHVREYLVYLIGSLMEHASLIEILIISQRMDIFCMPFRKNLASINKHLDCANPVETKIADYLNNIISVVLPVLITTWIQHGKTDSADQVFCSAKESFHILYMLDKFGTVASKPIDQSNACTELF